MNRLILALSAVLGFAFSQPASAFRASDIQTSVVKVSSGTRAVPGAFSGSGLLIRIGRDVYALSSEHVLPHSTSERFVFEVSNPLIAAQSARLFAVEWGNGLALLKLQQALPASVMDRLPTLSDFATVSRAGDFAAAAGYPKRSRSMILDAGTRVLDTQSQRHRMPLLQNSLELGNAHGEFGMSGGPIFDSSGTSIIGVLSHQFLRMVPGQSTRNEEFSATLQTIENHVIAIPAPVARDWIETMLRSPRSHFVRDSEDQLQERTTVYSQGLRFETLATDAPEAQGIGGSEGMGIGGSEGMGIGGSEGMGIGGSGGMGVGGLSTSAPRATARVGRITAVSSDVAGRLIPTSWPDHWNAELPREMLQRLRLQASLILPFFAPRSEGELLVNPIRFATLEEMIEGFGMPSLQPVFVSSDRAAQVASDLEQRGDRIRAAAQLFGTEGSSPEVTALLGRLRDLATLTRSSAVAQLNAQTIRALLNDRAGWDGLFEADFDQAVTLMRETRQLLNALERR